MSQRCLTVLQLVPDLESGGVERGTLEVAAELVRRGHRSLVISGGGRMVDQLRAEGSSHLTWRIGKKSPLTLGYVWHLRKLLRTYNVDIVHARSRVPAWVAWLAWRGLSHCNRPRFVTTCHGMHSVSWYSRIMTHGERVIAVSETIRNYIRDSYPQTPDEKISLIYRGVDTQEYPDGYQPSDAWLVKWQREFPQLADRPLITLAGRLTRLKGHADLIAAMQQLRTICPEAVAAIVGGEDPRRQAYAAELRETVRRNGLSNVVFTGHRTDLREIFAVSHVALSLSAKPESFGRTVLESLALGTPAIGYNHGGVAEILQKLFPEGAIPVGDVPALVDRLATFLRERPTVSASNPFTLANMLGQTVNLYEQLASERDARRTGVVAETTVPISRPPEEAAAAA